MKRTSISYLLVFLLFLGCAARLQAQTGTPATKPEGAITPGAIDATKHHASKEDEKGRKVETDKDAKGNIVHEKEFVSGVLRRITIYDWYHPNSNVGSKTEYILQGNGNIKVAVTTHDKDGKEVSRETWETDLKGKVIKGNSTAHPIGSIYIDPKIDEFRPK